MIKAHPISIAAVGVILSMVPLHAQERPDYRDFALGSHLAHVLEQLHVTASAVALVHQRPALIQDLRWWTPYFPMGLKEPRKDPVRQIVFSFCDDQLFRIAIEYNRNQTEGMTDGDMIAALSERYGLPLTPARPLTASAFAPQAAGEWSTPVAQWEDGDVVVVLLRLAFGSGFQLVVTSARLDSLAQAAAAESLRLDQSEAPAREIARQKHNAEEARLTLEKARAANKATFRP
jgi:hypothetical protein